MYLGQGKPVSSILFYGMIKFISTLETSGVLGIKVDVMEVTLPGLGILGEISGPLLMSCPHSFLFFPLGHDSPSHHRLCGRCAVRMVRGDAMWCFAYFGEGKMVPMLRLRMLIHSSLGPLPTVIDKTGYDGYVQNDDLAQEYQSCM